MSDRIKKIKIKQSDGTFSDYIPIGANAKDVDMANGYSLENTIGTIDVDEEGSIKTQLSKTTKYYDSVADMKADTQLTGGAAAVTLGYYKPNDGGGALYQIIDSTDEDYESLVDDGGSAHDLKNNLKAKLIVKDSINVKQFGAYGDGEHDDDAAIQNAINNIYNKEINRVYIPSGIYNIKNQIILPNYVKISTLDGRVIFNCYVEDKANFILTSTRETNLSLNYPISYYKSAWIDGSNGGFSFIYKGTFTNNSIAIQIGEENSVGGSQFFNGWKDFCDIYINGFYIGIYFYMKDLFLNTFKNLIFSNNIIGLYFSNQVSNSGEKILFENSIFGDGGKVAEVNTSDLELIFDNSSFDFMEMGIDIKAWGPIIKLSNCHFEGIGYTNTYSEKGDNPCLIYNSTTSSGQARVFIDSCDCMTIRDYLFKSANPNNTLLFLNSMTTKGGSGFNKFPALVDDNVAIVVNNFIPTFYGDLITQNKSNRKKDPMLNSLDVQDLTDNQKLDGYTFSSNISNKASITEEKQYNNNGKTIKIVVPSGGLWTTIDSEEIECIPGENLVNSIMWFFEGDEESITNSMRFNSKTTFYDEDHNTIDYEGYDINYANENMLVATINEWNRPAFLEHLIVPARAKTYKVRYIINPVTQGNLYLTNFYSGK